MKLLIVIDAKTKKILCVAFGEGRVHDFRLLKDSHVHFAGKIEVLADKGFAGMEHLHTNSTIPVKASKNHKLTSEEKKKNREISKRRIYIEHTNRHIKRFRILSARYRNKRRKFILRASLICGIYNFQYAS